MKTIVSLGITLALLLSMIGCAAHEHEWEDATCKQRKTCSVCGETEGEMMEHEWEEATCVRPRKCVTCKQKEGEALGHKWVEATYSAPKTCERCGKIEGSRLELADTCDEVLCRASYNQDEYVIVKNEREDYSGVYVEVGIIKNNAWLMEPTPDMPFVAVKVWDSSVPSAGRVEYLGYGCFVCSKFESDSRPLSSSYGRYIFYNVETGSTYTTETCSARLRSGGTESDEYYIVDYGHRKFTLLNKATFETKTIELVFSDNANYAGDYCAVSEGLFWACGYTANWISSSAFYDTNGNMVIDLSDHDVLPYQDLLFKNGKCTIKTRVDNGTRNPSYYRITIDKTGNVTQSKKISESEAYD